MKDKRMTGLQRKILTEIDDAGLRANYGWTCEEIANAIDYSGSIVSLRRTLRNMADKGLIQRKKELGLRDMFGRRIHWCWVYVLNKHFTTYYFDKQPEPTDPAFIQQALTYLHHGWSGSVESRQTLVNIVNNEPKVFRTMCEYMSELLKDEEYRQ